MSTNGLPKKNAQATIIHGAQARIEKFKKSVTVGKIWKLSLLSRKLDVSISFRLGVREEKVKMSLFKKIVKKVWRMVQPDYLQKLYHSMPQQMRAVVEAQGGHIKY